MWGISIHIKKRNTTLYMLVKALKKKPLSAIPASLKSLLDEIIADIHLELPL
jgi:hypothetical protein